MITPDEHQGEGWEESAPSGNRRRDVVRGVAGLVAGLLVLGSVWWLSSQRPSNVLLTVNEVQPYAAPMFTAATLDGTPVSLDDFKGKVVLLNFWASWCQPCKEETPDLEAVYQRLKNDGVVIVGVDVFRTEPDIQAVRDFVAQYGMSYPVVLDETGTISEDYAISPLPTSYFLDRQGQVRYVRIGKLSAAEIEQVFRRLQAEG